jgi:hypothetical protein
MPASALGRRYLDKDGSRTPVATRVPSGIRSSRQGVCPEWSRQLAGAPAPKSCLVVSWVQMTDRDRLLELGSAALARGAWFEAHECWERAWRLSAAPDRMVVQGLAQLAAALVHLSNGRQRGATSVLAKAHGKLMLPDTPAAVGTLDVTAVRSLIERLRNELAAGRTPDLHTVDLRQR